MEKVTLAQSENGIRFLSEASWKQHMHSPMKPPSNAACWWGFYERSLLIWEAYLYWNEYPTGKKAPVLFRGPHWEQLTISCVFYLTGNRCDPTPHPHLHRHHQKVSHFTQQEQDFYPFLDVLRHQHGRLRYLTWNCWIISQLRHLYPWSSFKLWFCGRVQIVAGLYACQVWFAGHSRVIMS